MCVDVANKLLTRHSPLAPLGQVDECVDVANKLLTRHSPLAPLGQVDEWTAKPSRFSIQVVCRSFLELWRLKH